MDSKGINPGEPPKVPICRKTLNEPKPNRNISQYMNSSQFPTKGICNFVNTPWRIRK